MVSGTASWTTTTGTPEPQPVSFAASSGTNGYYVADEKLRLKRIGRRAGGVGGGPRGTGANAMIASKLESRRDPHEILEALYEVPKVQQPDLVGVVAPLLDHGDAYIREEALRILVTRWKLEPYRQRAAEMLNSDESPDVRGAAAYALAAVATDTTRGEHTRLLLATLRKMDEDCNVRGAAYDALLILYRNPAFPTRKRDFDPALDVDWQWIGSLDAAPPNLPEREGEVPGSSGQSRMTMFADDVLASLRQVSLELPVVHHETGSAFGDTLCILSDGSVLYRIVRDRGQLFLDIGRMAEPIAWVDSTAASGVPGDRRTEAAFPDLSGIAAYIQQNRSKFKAFAG